MDQAVADEDLLMEKQAILMELDHLKSQGVSITREFSMSDSLESMQFEVRRHLNHMDETRMVGMMTDAMKMGFTMLELASKRYGVLDLDGFSAEVTSGHVALHTEHDPHVPQVLPQDGLVAGSGAGLCAGCPA